MQTATIWPKPLLEQLVLALRLKMHVVMNSYPQYVGVEIHQMCEDTNRETFVVTLDKVKDRVKGNTTRRKAVRVIITQLGIEETIREESSVWDVPILHNVAPTLDF